MRILVTGCAGLIGANFCKWVDESVEIFGVDDLSGGYIENVPSKVHFIKADLTDKDDQQKIEDVFPVDYVFHFAAYAAEGLSPFIRQYNYRNNVLSTVFLVGLSIKHRVKRFIFTSSMAVYGDGGAPFSEDLLPCPIDSYGIAKYSCEMDIKVAWEQHGLEYCIIRPHNVYGPMQNIWDPYRNVLGIWMFKSLNNAPITIYGDGEQKRAFSYIEDVLPCIWEAAVRPAAKNQIVNLGGIHEISLNEASKIMKKITKNDDVIYMESRHEVKNAWSTYQKSIDILGYKENTDLVTGLGAMWEWARLQPSRPRKMWEKYELDIGIYSFWRLL
jgi:UDP-glucose 4-epimerase